VESIPRWSPIGRYGEAVGLSAGVRSTLRRGTPLLAPGMAFAVTLLYGVLEYARPQDALPGLAPLRLSLLTSGILAVVVLKFAREVQWFSPQVLVLSAVLGMMYAWVPFATNNYWALKTTLVLTQTYLFVVAIATFVDTERRLRVFALTWIASGLFQALYGISHGGTGSGYFQADENDFALSMCMILPFSILTARAMPARWARILCWATAAACVAGVVVSSSRGGFVGLVTTGGMLVLLSRQRVRMLLAGAVAVGALALFAPQEYWDEMRTITDEGGTRADRMVLWGIAWDVYRANPVLGVGPSNVNWVINDYQEYDPESRMMGGRAVHSLYMTLLAELGTLGALLFLVLLALNARDILALIRGRRGREGFPAEAYARAIACSLVAYLVCGIFLTVIWYPHLYVLTAIALATGAVARKAAPAAPEGAASGLEARPPGALAGLA
jgi:probable O-glycosylation ligase (exosortase A-associated)